MIVDPSKQARVRGENNIARYLSRLLPAIYPLNYDSLNWDDIIQIDGILEKVADNLPDLKFLENKLGGSRPFIHGEATISDFVLFSSVISYLKNNPTIQIKKFPLVSKWLDACQELGGFRLNFL